MAIPDTISVRISSEGAELISVTPVVVQQITPLALIELVLGQVGKDRARVRELLIRGTVVRGGSRFRWSTLETSPEELESLLAGFPDPDPTRPFDSSQCIAVVLRSGLRHLEITRDAGAKRRFLRRKSFWDVLMSVAVSPEYIDYSFAERADRYRSVFSAEARESLRAGAPLLAYSKLEAKIRDEALISGDYLVSR